LYLTRVRDSAAVRIARVLPAGQADSVAQKARLAREDSIARADTSAKGRAALARADSLKKAQATDSAAQAQRESIRAARDTVRKTPPPKFERLVPTTEFVVTTAEPIPFDVPLRLSARGVEALVGPARSSDRVVQRRKPPPVDSTRNRPPTRRDTTAARKVPPGDTTVRKVPPGDTAVRKVPPRDTTPARKPSPRDAIGVLFRHER